MSHAESRDLTFATNVILRDEQFWMILINYEMQIFLIYDAIIYKDQLD